MSNIIKYIFIYIYICIQRLFKKVKKNFFKTFRRMLSSVKSLYVRTHGEEKRTQFLNKVKNFHSNLKFTCKTSCCTVEFLDLNASLRNGPIHIDLCIKPADGHHHLQYQSSHPLHVTTSKPYRQALAVSRICSSEKDFKMQFSHTKEWLLARGYPEIVVNNQTTPVHRKLPVPESLF